MDFLSSDTGKALAQIGFTTIDKCVGKTIECVETFEMQYECTFYHCWLIRFTDGSRAWEANQVRGMSVGPNIEKLKNSSIITADEYGRMVASKKRYEDSLRESHRQSQLRRLKQDAASLGLTIEVPEQ